MKVKRRVNQQSQNIERWSLKSHSTIPDRLSPLYALFAWVSACVVIASLTFTRTYFTLEWKRIT
jgi:hypothetical protein